MTKFKTVMLLTGMLTILKLTGDLTSSWWLVTALIWIPVAAITVLLLTIMAISYLLNSKTTNELKKNKRNGRK